jgi:hypothetical protein
MNSVFYFPFPLISNNTATIMIVPLMINWKWEETFNISNPFPITAISKAPITTPYHLPAPPDILTPPMMTAAIASNSYEP